MAQQIMSPREEDEDWRKLTDANERRRAQNRIAQRNYRRNIKRRLQQLESFTRDSSVTSPALKQPQSSCVTPTRLTTQFSKTSLSPITPAASDVLLPDLDSISVLDAEVSDSSSTQTLVFSHTEQTEALQPAKEHEQNAAMTTHQIMDSSSAFDCITPLTDLENDLILFGRSAVPPTRPTSSQYLNALQKAVVKGHHSISELLVENGADVYTVDDGGNNILHLAAQFGHPSLISFALSHCLNVNDINMEGNTPLHVAIEHNHADIVQMLIRAGADMEYKSG